jgi:hypothetical protein
MNEVVNQRAFSLVLLRSAIFGRRLATGASCQARAMKADATNQNRHPITLAEGPSAPRIES